MSDVMHLHPLGAFELQEQAHAKRIADQLLDAGDVDCDACVLARQYLHACERIDLLETELATRLR
jgi:hypothetical protein